MSTLQWLEDSSSGTAYSAQTLQWLEDSSSGTAAVRVLPFAGILSTYEPEQDITLTAVLEGGGSADSYTWSRISGPSAATITGSGASVTVRVPSFMSGNVPASVDITIGVVATKSGVSSPQQTVTFTALPQTHWVRLPGGSSWVGSRPVYTAA